MAKSLVIVESPAKAKTINKILGSSFVVKASVGHVIDLPNNKLGVDIENDFKPEYITMKGKGKILTEIKQAAKKVDKVFLAADPDREGEAISWHIARKLGVKEENIYRLLFNEITKSGILSAIESPGRINMDKVNAQQARRILDRLVGYQISPLLWKKVKRGLSAGRVQSVALRIISEREMEIKAFDSEEYWSIEADLSGKEKKRIKAKLHHIDGKVFKIASGEEAKAVVDKVKDSLFTVSKIKEKKVSRKPAPPFITSSLQQEGARKMSFTSKQTMRVAQSLYEGVDIGGGDVVGLITYMRTDSTRISKESQEEARKFIGDNFGREYVPKTTTVYKSKKNAQDAHEAVRPTSVYRRPEDLKGILDKDQFRLYQLIWKRFVSSQMEKASILQTSVDIQADNCTFRTSGSVIKFYGFMRLYLEGNDENPENEKTDEQEKILPPLKEGEELKLEGIEQKQHFTQPPPRYTESSLIKTLEEKGIGRPSTYSTIISTVLAREYVVKEKKQLAPTTLGTLINELLVGAFPDILNVKFTAKMEGELDLIEEGRLKWSESLKEFYSSFSVALKEADKSMKSMKEPEMTDLDCPTCEKKLAIKWGKNGRFLACSNYPECRTTMDFEVDSEGKIKILDRDETTDEKCDSCGQAMVIKRGKFGKFLACSNYPKCKKTSPILSKEDGSEELQKAIAKEKCEKCGSQMMLKVGRYGRFLACSEYPKCKNAKAISLGINCPNEGCGGYLTEKGTKRGKMFYGCSNYPKCRYATWNKPVKSKCPECGAEFLLEDSKEQITKCSNSSCNYTVTS